MKIYGIGYSYPSIAYSTIEIEAEDEESAKDLFNSMLDLEDDSEIHTIVCKGPAVDENQLTVFDVINKEEPE